MNFIDAALSVLKGSRKSLTAQELVAQVSQKNLLSRPGSDPLRSMQAALLRELKKGDESRVEQARGERWKLAPDAAEAEAETKPSSQRKGQAQGGQRAAREQEGSRESSRESSKKAKAAPAVKKTAAKAGASAEKPASAGKAASKKKPGRGRRAAEEETPDEIEATEAEAAGLSASDDSAQGRESEGEMEREGAEESAVEVPAERAEQGRRDRQRRRGRRGVGRRDEDAEETALADEARAAAAAAFLEGLEPTAQETTFAQPAAAADASVADTDQDEDDEQAAPSVQTELTEILAPRQQPLRGHEVPTGEDADLAAIYGDELSGTAPGAAFAEYHDSQTADEDRPMMPEIVPSREGRNKRDRRRRKRDDRFGNRRPETGREREAVAGESREAEPVREAAPLAEAAAEPTSRAVEPDEALPAAVPATGYREAAVLYRPGNEIGDGAFEVMVSLKTRQPVQVRQLAQMMRRRELWLGDPDRHWSHIKAALLSDEQSYQAFGLRPRIVYRGRDIFALGAEVPALSAVEASFAQAVTTLAQATLAEVKSQLCQLSRDALERVANLYLVRQGWRDLEWIKHTSQSTYATGISPGGVGTVLIGVHAGQEPVGRRGIGELRVGVQAKKLVAGILIAPQDLSDAALHELGKAGPSISLLVGDSLVSALAAASVGVSVAQVPTLRYDDRFFRELAGE